MTGMIEWGQKSKPGANPVKTKKILGPKLHPLKNPMPNFRSIKISRGTSRTRPHETQELSRISSDRFEYPQKTLLKSSYQKNTCQKFPTKNPEIEKSPPKILRSSLALEIRSTPRPHPSPNPTGSSSFICQVSK